MFENYTYDDIRKALANVLGGDISNLPKSHLAQLIPTVIADHHAKLYYDDIYMPSRNKTESLKFLYQVQYELSQTGTYKSLKEE